MLTVQLNSIFQKIFQIACVISFITGSVYLLSKPAANDDLLFIENLNLIKSNGWYHAIASKISIPFLLLAYPFSFIFSTAFSLKFVNILLFIVLLVYFVKKGAIKNTIFYYLFLFYSSTGWYISATNDPLLVVSLVIFFNEVYKLLVKNEGSLILVWISSIVAFFTREMVIIYLPIILFSFYLLYKKGINLFKFNAISVATFLLLLSFNIPSLIENKSLSYDNKLPPVDVKSNWAQRQYLAQLLVNQGKLEHGQHPNWEETDAYLERNGSNSLPNSTFSGIFFDVKLTFIEFFKDYAEVLFYSIRQTGFIILFILLNLFISLFKQKSLTNLYVPIICFTMIAAFSFIIISYIETRWLIAVFIISILYYSDWINENEKLKKLNFINNILITLVIVYGLYKIYLKV